VIRVPIASLPEVSARTSREFPVWGATFFKKRWSFAHIDDDNLQFAVVVEIPDRKTPRRVGSDDAG
jgi:hypothetical protein